ncbi:MAG TPA: DNA gyrase subunit B, partial [Myxococcales bacterium]|nr:DNA gyrase subunit B [Myxococcales bacterium]
YIAQPPLFRVKKGKKSQFLKNEDAFNRFILEAGTDKLAIRAVGGSVIVTGDPLRRLLDDLWKWRKLLRALERRAQSEILAALVRGTDLDASGLADRARLEEAMARLEEA